MRSVAMGRADLEFESMHDYAALSSAVDLSVQPAKSLRKDEAKRAGVAFGMGSGKLSQ